MSDETRKIEPEIEPGEEDKRVIKVNDPQIITKAAARLFLNLRSLIQGNPYAECSPQVAEQLKARDTLLAVNRFVEQAWCDTDTMEAQRYLLNVAGRFDQLQHGVKHLSFEATKPGRKGAVPDIYEVWDARKFVCAAVECLMCTGDRRRAAACSIAKNPVNDCLKRLIRDVNEKTVTQVGSAKLADAIQSWHKTFRSGGVVAPVQATWPHVLQAIKREDEAPREAWEKMAQECLDKARMLAQKLFIKPEPPPIA